MTDATEAVEPRTCVPDGTETFGVDFWLATVTCPVVIGREVSRQTNQGNDHQEKSYVKYHFKPNS